MEQSVTSLVTRSHAKKNDGTFSNIVSQDSGYSVDSEKDGRAQERLSLRASPSNRFVPIFDKIFLWLTVFCHLLPICSANSGCLEFLSAWALSYTARNTNYQITAGPANRLSNNSAAARLGRDTVQPPRFISSSIFSVRQTVCTTAEMLSWLCLSVCLSVS